MIFKYKPLDILIIDKSELKFGEERKLVRLKLNGAYEEDNQIIDLGSSQEDAIFQRRDIYKNINRTDSFFILGYDRNDLLSEVEVHECDTIEVLGNIFNFDSQIDDIVTELSEYSSVNQINEGEFFFKELRIVITNKKQMGGYGNRLGYFYCSSDVTHLGQ